MRPAKKGKRAGWPWMCVWQSQAPAGTSKCTGVAGWDAVAWLVRGRRRAPVASAPTRMARRVSIGSLLSGLQNHNMRMGEIVMPVGAPISVQAFRRDAHGMPGNPAKARFVQDVFICFLGPIIVANVYRPTGGEHCNVEGGSLVQGARDGHARLVLFNAW